MRNTSAMGRVASITALAFYTLAVATAQTAVTSVAAQVIDLTTGAVSGETGTRLSARMTAGPQRIDSPHIATPPTIAEQPLIRTIYNWGDDVAVITEEPATSRKESGYGLAIVDPRGSRIVPFHMISCDSYEDVGYSEQLGKIVVCRRGDAAQLYRSSRQGWVKFSDAVHGREFRCTIDRDRIALISDAAVYLFSTASQKSPARINIGFRKILSVTGRLVPSAALLSQDSILLAYDAGEFGGALYRINLSEPTVPTMMIDDNVKFLARSPSGAIWAASGLAHMMGEHGALYRIDGTGAHVVSSISGLTLQDQPPSISQKSGVEFPTLTTVAGLAFENTERPIVVLPELGVLELSDDRFTPRYRAMLLLRYSESPRLITISFPVGLVTTTSGDLYVA